MYLFKILLILFSSIFIRISKTEETLPETLPRTKSGNELENCVCIPKGETLYPELLNPQDFQRLVVYIYRDIHTNELKVFTPDPEIQAVIPNIPVSANDEVKTVKSETISSLINKAPNNIIFRNDMDINNTDGGYIELLGTKQNINNVKYDNGQQIPQEMYQQNDPYNNTKNNPLYTQSHLYTLNKLDPYQIKKLTEVFDRLKDQFNNKKSEYLGTQSNINFDPNDDTMKFKKKLTFDQWFNKQIKVFLGDKAVQGIHMLNTDYLKTLVQKVLIENHMIIDSSGLITDENGVSINLNKLELRSALICNPITNKQVLQGDLTLKHYVPYLEGILITIHYPPRILGIIPLKNAYYAIPSDHIKSSISPDLNVDHYFIVPKYDKDNEHHYHISLSSSDSKPNLDSSAPPVLKVKPAETSHHELPLKAYEVSTPRYNHWLHTLLKALLNSNNDKILNASKNTQKRLMTETNKSPKHDTIQDNDAWNNINPSGQLSRRMNDEVDPYQNSKDFLAINYNDKWQLPVPLPVLSNPPVGVDSANSLNAVSLPYSNTDSYFSQRVHSPFNLNLLSQSDWFQNPDNDELHSLKFNDLYPHTFTPSGEKLAPIPSFDGTYHNRVIHSNINTNNLSPPTFVSFTKNVLNPSSVLDWKPYPHIETLPNTINSSFDIEWNSPKNLHFPNYDSKSNPIILTPCDSKLNSLSTSGINHYPTQYNHIDLEHDSKSYANAIPYLKTESPVLSRPDNGWLPYLDYKGHSDPYNIPNHLMTIPYNKAKSWQFHPRAISSTYTDPNQKPHYNIDGTPEDNALPFVTPEINYIPPISTSNIKAESSSGVSPPADISYFGYSVNRDPYLTLPDITGRSKSNFNMISDDSFNFQRVGDEPYHPGPPPYIEPIYNKRKFLRLSNWNVKPKWDSKNSETNKFTFENSMNINKPEYLIPQVSASNNFDHINLDKNFRQNRRQGFSQYSNPGLKSVVKSVMNIFMDSLPKDDNNRRSGDQRDVTVDDSGKKPGKIDVKDEERPVYRIIGGSAATGSGAPVSNKGRSGERFKYNKTF